MDFNVEHFKKDILKIYKYLQENEITRKCGLIDHNVFQEKLFLLSKKYNLVAKKEYVGNIFKDVDTGKNKRGRIDIVYYYKNISF